jgi:hypothetical protein
MPGFLSFMAAVLCKAVLYLLFGFGRGFEEEVPLLCVGSKNGLAVARQVLPILSGQVLGCRWRSLLSLSSSHFDCTGISERHVDRRSTSECLLQEDCTDVTSLGRGVILCSSPLEVSIVHKNVSQQLPRELSVVERK